jgi:hypothetical protein
MFGFLKSPHMFALSVAFLTALLSYLYARTTESTEHAQNKVFWKTLIIGVISALLITWLAHGRQEQVATEPFNTDI